MRQLGSFFHVAMNGMTSTKRIFALLDTPEPEHGTATLPANDSDSADDGLTVRFDHVGYSYDDAGHGDSKSASAKADKQGETSPNSAVAPALTNITFAAQPGQFTAIVGISGSGKSTAASLLAGTLADYRGSLTLNGVEVSDLSGETLAGAVTVIGASSHLFAGTLRENLLMALPDDEIPDSPDSVDSRLWSALEQARIAAFVHAQPNGLDMPIESDAANLSGGQRQRVLIAMALTRDPKLVVADEPTTALDVTVQKKILDHLHMLTDSLGTAVLFITHDLGLAAERAQHIVVMYKGQVVESGPSLEVLQHPQHPYTKRLVAAAPSLASQRIISAKERGENADALLDHHVAGERTLEKSEHIITVDHLTKEFKLPRKKEMFKAVDDVSFSVKRGTTLAIVGESGSGKSTVANMVLHLLKPTSGKVFYEGRDTSTFKAKDLLGFRRHVQPVFQNPYGSLDPMYSIFRSIEEPLRIHKIGDKKSRANRVKELLDMVEMPTSVMGRYPNELSGGQRQRIAIARAMALDPDVIVCDEAVSALDVLVQDQVLRLLNDLQAEKGLSYLFITHDLAVVRQIADEVVVMQHGKLVEHATTDEVFDHPQKQYTRDLLDAIPGGKLQLGLD